MLNAWFNSVHVAIKTEHKEFKSQLLLFANNFTCSMQDLVQTAKMVLQSILIYFDKIHI